MRLPIEKKENVGKFEGKNEYQQKNNNNHCNNDDNNDDDINNNVNNI